MIAANESLIWPKLTLDVAPAWIEQHCIVPDGEDTEAHFILRDFQLCFVSNHYAIKPTARRGMLNTAFMHRRSQLMDAQKKGKSPLLAAMICLEGVGPALFDGFAKGGEVYDCRDFGCGCGWQYEYLPGEPMGKAWATPLIQLTATSLEQTDNTYDALRPMIDNGPLSDVIGNTGEEVIRLPGGKNCKIEPVTSKASSRLGQRVTFVPWDETGLYTKENGMWKVFNTQDRGVTAMGGRGVETTNCYDPAVQSIAKRTHEDESPWLYKQYVKPPENLDFKDPAQRRLILEFNYADAPWANNNLDAIEQLCAELMVEDPAEAERFYGNRMVVGSGHWISEADWMSKAEVEKDEATGKDKAKFTVEPRTPVTLGIDLSNNNDWTGIRAETEDLYQFTPTYGVDSRKTIWRPTDYGGRIPRGEVEAAIDHIANHFRIVRAYVDPAGSAKGASQEDGAIEDDSWRLELKAWQAKYLQADGKPAFFPWETYRIQQMHAALETFKSSVLNPESKFRHDGCETTKFHIRNAIVVNKTQQRYVLGKPNEHQKIDLTQSAVLAHEAAQDALLAGEFKEPEVSYGWI